MKIIFFVISILTTALIHADSNICNPNEPPKSYHKFCTAPYVQNDNDQQNGTVYQCKLHNEIDDENRADVVSNLSADDQQKKPYLVYYAIDPEEPFMKTVVDYEIKKLRQACQAGDHVNFAIFLNSWGNHKITVPPWGNIHTSPFFAYCGDKHPDLTDVSNDLGIQAEGRFRIVQPTAEVMEEMTDRQFLLQSYRFDFWEHPVCSPEISQDDCDDFFSWRDYQNDPTEMLFQVLFDFSLRDAFVDYYFSHPDLFFIVTELLKKTIFPKDKYLPFYHIKSHGSMNSLMTGLTNNQLTSKVQCQEKLMAANGLIMTERYAAIKDGHTGLGFLPKNRFLVSPFTTKKYLQDNNIELDEYGTIICTANCDDDVYGDHGGTLGDFGGRLSSERRRMGGDLGDGGGRLGTDFGNLGATDALGSFEGALGKEDNGLGVLAAFGTPFLKMNQILTDMILNSPNSSTIPFMMFESCESNVTGKKTIFDFQKMNLPQLKAFYSAKGSLWYRNLNWHYLLDRAKGHSGDLQKAVISATLGISNRCVKAEGEDKCKE